MNHQSRDLHTFALCFVAGAVFMFLSLFFLPRAYGAEQSKTLTVLRSLSVHVTDRDEEPEARLARLTEIAEAIDFVARDKTERAVLIVKARRESGLARFVDLDWPKCRDGHGGFCDHSRAWSLWQLHDTSRTGTRLDAATIAIKRFRAAGAYCAARGFDRLIGAYALYSTGRLCSTADAKSRAAETLAIVGRL